MEVVKSVENIIRETFTKEGIPSTDSRKFNPHLTVMKLSDDPMCRRKGITKIQWRVMQAGLIRALENSQ